MSSKDIFTSGAAELGGLGGGQAAPPRFARAIYKMIGLWHSKYEFDDAYTQLPHHFFALCSAPATNSYSVSFQFLARNIYSISKLVEKIPNLDEKLFILASKYKAASC